MNQFAILLFLNLQAQQMQLISMLSSTASKLSRPWRCMMSAAETAAQTDTFFFFLTQNPNSNYPLWLYWIISRWDWLLAQENDERTPMTPCTAWPMMTCMKITQVFHFNQIAPLGNCWHCCMSAAHPSNSYSESPSLCSRKNTKSI